MPIKNKGSNNNNKNGIGKFLLIRIIIVYIFVSNNVDNKIIFILIIYFSIKRIKTE